MKRFISLLLLLTLALSLCAPLTASASLHLTRATVLVLDVSGSMDGEPLETLKEAAIKFCRSVLQSEGSNNVAIVSYATYANIESYLTDDLDELTAIINNLTAYGRTNIQEGLEYGADLLFNCKAEIKNLVLMSDGLPNEGLVNYSGPYDSLDYDGYEFANGTYDLAKSYHEPYNLYTLGFFHSLDVRSKDFASRFLKDLQDSGYYEANNVDELVFAFGELAEQITALSIEADFTYHLGKDYTETCFYTDQYFNTSAEVYQPSLATMSLSLAMSAFSASEKDYTYSSRNVENLLYQLQFQDIKPNADCNETPSTNSIGVTAGWKEIPTDSGKTVLLVAAVRGGNYTREWGGNFVLGSEGDHDGFELASNTVLSFLKDYVADHSEHIQGDIKLWIVGYSRGGATANLTAARLNEGFSLGDHVTLSRDNTFAYCFEAPAGAFHPNANDEALYGNIHNIINPNDLVPKVAPKGMKFSRYGVDHFTPTALMDTSLDGIPYAFKRDAMLKQYRALPSTKDNSYAIDGFIYCNPSNILPLGEPYKTKADMGVTLDMAIGKLSPNLLGRYTYASKIEDGIVTLFDMHYDGRIDFGPLLGEVVKKYFYSIFTGKYKADNEDNLDEMVNILVAAAKDGGAVFSAQEEKELRKALRPAVAVLLAYAVQNPGYCLTFYENLDRIKAAHMPDLCLAWLRAADPYYNGEPFQLSENAAYRLVRINCPVQVEVVDSQGNVVARFLEEQFDDLGSSITAYVNDSGEKLVVLPPNQDFSLTIRAVETASVSYSIQEQSYSTESTLRSVNYYDIPMEAGQALSTQVPAYSKEDLKETAPSGSNTVYSVYSPSGTLLQPSEELTGDAAARSYIVTALSGDETLGNVLGGGFHNHGTFARVEALAAEGCEFTGWYAGEKLLSSEAVYRFCVLEDVTLTAQFARTEQLPTHTEPPRNGVNPYLLGILLFAVLLIGLVVALPLILLRSKNQKEALPELPVHSPAPKAPIREQPPKETPPLSPPPPPVSIAKPAYITFLTGKMEGQRFPIKDGETLRIGRSPSRSDIIVTGDYPHVSRMHCMVTYDAKQDAFIVVDSSSTGTLRSGGKTLPNGQRCTLRRGEKLYLADRSCTLRLD